MPTRKEPGTLVRKARSRDQVVVGSVKLPSQVLVRVQALVEAKKPALPEARPLTPPKGRLLARQKVVAALRKLHPMD